MSINGCSINFHTINARCLRSPIIPPVVVTGGGQQQHVRADTRVPLNIFRRDREEVELEIESSTLNVVVEFMGEKFSQTINASPTDDTAVITVFDFQKNEEILINISDIKITRL